MPPPSPSPLVPLRGAQGRTASPVGTCLTDLFRPHGGERKAALAERMRTVRRRGGVQRAQESALFILTRGRRPEGGVPTFDVLPLPQERKIPRFGWKVIAGVIGAVGLVALLSLTPREGFLSALLPAPTGPIAEVRLAGLARPSIALVFTEHPEGGYVQMRLRGERGGTQSEIILTVPGEWHLEEVAGMHVRELGRHPAAEGLQELVLPQSSEEEAVFIFSMEVPPRALSFRSLGGGPALLTLTTIRYPAGEATRRVELVEGGRVFPL